MNKAELISLLRDPAEIQKGHLDDLEGILEDYPFFLAARLLLAKGSKELHEKSAKERIASAAIYSTDRVLLKKYLSGKLFFLSAPPSNIPDDEPEVKVEKNEKSKKKSEKQDGPLVVPEIPSGHLDEILDELKQDMENLRSSRHHFLEVQQKIEEEDAVTAALERAIRKKKPDLNHTVENKDNALEKKKSGLKTDPDKLILKETPVITSKDIIEKFIQEEPSIKRKQPKAEAESIEDLSKKSYSWNKDLASEYLAEIYLHQGNKQRAKEIYEVLMLKFPDKSLYFADLISKLD